MKIGGNYAAHAEGGEKLQCCCCTELHVERCLTIATRMTALSRSLSACDTNECCTVLRGAWAASTAWKERLRTDAGTLRRSFRVPGRSSPKELSLVYLSCRTKCCWRLHTRNPRISRKPLKRYFIPGTTHYGLTCWWANECPQLFREARVLIRLWTRAQTRLRVSLEK